MEELPDALSVFSACREAQERSKDPADDFNYAKIREECVKVLRASSENGASGTLFEVPSWVYGGTIVDRTRMAVRMHEDLETKGYRVTHHREDFATLFISWEHLRSFDVPTANSLKNKKTHVPPKRPASTSAAPSTAKARKPVAKPSDNKTASTAAQPKRYTALLYDTERLRKQREAFEKAAKSPSSGAKRFNFHGPMRRRAQVEGEYGDEVVDGDQEMRLPKETTSPGVVSTVHDDGSIEITL